MPLTADWSVRAEPIALSKFSHMAKADPTYIKRVYRSGDLGPPPNVAADVLQIPLYHAAAFFVVQEACKKGVKLGAILEALPAIVERLSHPALEERVAEANRRLDTYRQRLITLRSAREYVDFMRNNSQGEQLERVRQTLAQLQASTR